MKKILSIILCIALILSQTGCKKQEAPKTAVNSVNSATGNKDTELKIATVDTETSNTQKETPTVTNSEVTGAKTETQSTQTVNSADTASQTEKEQKTGQDKQNAGSAGVSDDELVEVLMVSGITSELTEASLEEMVQESGYVSGKLNDDGSATLVMTAAQKREYLKSIKEMLDEQLVEIESDETYAGNIASITYSDDFKVFTVALRSGKLTLTDMFVAMALSVYGATYVSAEGGDASEIRIDYIDAITGEIITSTADENFGDDVDIFGSLTTAKLTPSDLTDYVVEDTDDFTFRIDSIDPNGGYGYLINLTIANKTDEELSFTWKNESINDWSEASYFGTTVSAGETVTETVSYSRSNIESKGITDPTKIQFTLVVTTGGYWDEEIVWKKDYSIYPLGEESFVSNDFVPEEDDLCICDNKYATVYLTDNTYDDFWGYQMKFVIKNNSDMALSIGWNDVCVNDWNATAYMNVDVAPGKYACVDASFNDSEIQRFEIDTLGKVSFFLQIREADTWDDINLYDGDRIEIYPEGKDAYKYVAREPKESDIAYDEEELYTFVITGFDMDDWGDYELSFYFENRMDEAAWLSFPTVIINGIEIEKSYYQHDLPSERRVMQSEYIYDWLLSEYEIEEIESLAITYAICAEDDYWMDDPIAVKTITIK